MRIRNATLEDKDHIRELTNLLYLEMSEFVWNTDEYITKQIERGEYFIAQENDAVVGIISFRVRESRMYIETLAVVKEFQSNNVGTELIAFAKQHTKEKGIQVLRACAFYEYGNDGFYKKQGFSLLEKPGVYKSRKFHRFEMGV